MAQVEKRTAAQRREYFRQYHEGRRLAQRINTARGSPTVAREPARAAKLAEKNRLPIKFLPKPTIAELRAAFLKRQAYLESVGGEWPERRADHPESIEETLRRVR